MEKEEREVALLIEGEKGTGKSYIVEEFAKENYESYILIDFNKVGNEIKELFDNYLDDLDKLFMYLTNYYKVDLKIRKSLIIFDEVQLCPRARSAIKYLVADGRYDYIETGSLISIKKNVQNILIPSEERHIKMYPMDFEKFLWVMGNDKLMNLIKMCFEEIPSQLSKHEKRFTLNSLDKDARFRDYSGAFFWLQESMIVNIAYNTTEPNIGLRLNKESSALKCYMGDTGLLLSLTFDEKGLMDEEIYKKILFNKLLFNEGMIIENIVAQILVAIGKNLYFSFNYDKENSNILGIVFLPLYMTYLL